MIIACVTKFKKASTGNQFPVCVAGCQQKYGSLLALCSDDPGHELQQNGGCDGR